LSKKAKEWVSGLNEEGMGYLEEAAGRIMSEKMQELESKVNELTESREKEANAFADSLHDITRRSANSAVEELFEGEDSEAAKEAVKQLDFGCMSADCLSGFQNIMSMFGKQASRLRNSSAPSDEGSRKRSRSSPSGSSVPEGGSSAKEMSRTTRDLLLGKRDASL
jgi:hypothetical protein